MPVSILGVIVAAIVAFVLGFLWYSPMLFGNLWMKLTKVTKKDVEKSKKEGMAGKMVVGFISTLVMAYVLALFMGYVGATSVGSALLIAFLAWMGFIATTLLGTVLWERKPLNLYILNNAYNLLSLLIMTIILVYL